MHHTDGPAYFPRVAILTLDGSAALSFKKSIKDKANQNIILFPKSLLIFEDELYRSYLHGIDKNWDDEVDELTINCENELGKLFPRTLRVSLTIRYVTPKIS
jgi:alkylated DNA repair protein alkB family protein 6